MTLSPPFSLPPSMTIHFDASFISSHTPNSTLLVSYLETDYLHCPDKKHLSIYEVAIPQSGALVDESPNDLGRLVYSVEVPYSANKLVPIAGDCTEEMAEGSINEYTDSRTMYWGPVSGPGGVLVCSDGLLSYFHHSSTTPVLGCLPRRTGFYHSDPSPSPPLISSHPSLLIVSAVLHPNPLFLLLQSELGDLYRVSFEVGARGLPNRGIDLLRIEYFDTIQTALSLTLLHNNCIFAASESGTISCTK